MNHNITGTNKTTVTILRIVSVISIGLMGAGLGLFLAGGQTITGVHFMGFRQAFSGALFLQPVALMTMGMIILLITPSIRVIGALFSFLFVEKDVPYALISLGVLLILAASLFVPGVK